MQLGIGGAPCDAALDLILTRAICFMGPAEGRPKTNVDPVMLGGGGVVIVRSD